ncbi:MAG: TIR domain-containing protein [Sphingomonas sp.]|nr:TIR domain-containing protein [Sphingomonas sp.]
MAYRNGTYIAFHAEGITDPTASDIKYFNIMKAWHENDDISFRFINSHDKVYAVRDSSKMETLRRSLVERLNNSKNMVLIVGPRTRYDLDWVPFEINYAVEKCGLPIIVTYPGYTSIMNPKALSELWPKALANHIGTGAVRAIHVPFQRNAIDAAIRQYDLNKKPGSSLDYWSATAHRSFGINV